LSFQIFLSLFHAFLFLNFFSPFVMFLMVQYCIPYKSQPRRHRTFIQLDFSLANYCTLNAHCSAPNLFRWQNSIFKQSKAFLLHRLTYIFRNPTSNCRVQLFYICNDPPSSKRVYTPLPPCPPFLLEVLPPSNVVLPALAEFYFLY
jgi:hypothetical protein